MIQKAKKSFALRTVFVFIAYLISYVFVWPQIDNFNFSRETENTLKLIFDYSVNYGNGRLLGNIIVSWISENFYLAAFLIPVAMTLIVLLFNNVFFNNNKITLLLTAIIFALPSCNLVDECYYMSSGFCNYALPALFILISAVCIKNYSHLHAWKKTAVLFITFISTFASCLFSENTTITVVFASLLFAIICIKNRKSLTVAIVNAISAVLSATVFVLLPIVTDTTHKLDSYRGIASGIKAVAVYCLRNFSYFSKYFGEMTILTILLALSLLKLIKESEISEKLKYFFTFTGISYVVITLFLTLYNSNSFNATHISLIESVFTVLFFVCIFYTIIKVKNAGKKLKLLCLFLILISSIAPLMIVSSTSPRIYYLSFFTSLIFSVTVLTDNQNILSALENDKIRKILEPVSAVLLTVISVVFLIQSVYNFDLFAMRSEYIKQKVAETSAEEQISVPFVPCKSIHNENSSFKFGYTDDIMNRLDFVELTSWEKYDDYKNATLTFPSAVKFAIDNIEYKNPDNLE